MKDYSESRTRWAANNRDKMREYQRNYKRRKAIEYADVQKNSRLKINYDITLDDYNQMLVEQEYKCLICASDLKSDRNTCVDHNHSTGAVRGLLCRQCNRTLGLLKDCQKTLKRALAYLEEKDGAVHGT